MNLLRMCVCVYVCICFCLDKQKGVFKGKVWPVRLWCLQNNSVNYHMRKFYFIFLYTYCLQILCCSSFKDGIVDYIDKEIFVQLYEKKCVEYTPLVLRLLCFIISTHAFFFVYVSFFFCLHWGLVFLYIHPNRQPSLLYPIKMKCEKQNIYRATYTVINSTKHCLFQIIIYILFVYFSIKTKGNQTLVKFLLFEKKLKRLQSYLFT